MRRMRFGFVVKSVVWGCLGYFGFVQAQITLSVQDATVQQGTTVDVPVQIQGIGPADGILAYQLTMGFSSTVLEAVDATSEGTITATWGEPVVGPKTDTVRVGGYTVDQPLETDGVLVKLKFLVLGDAGSSKSVDFLEVGMYNLDGEVSVGGTTAGTLTVSESTETMDVDLVLHPGWNLVSFPVVADPQTLPEVLGGLPVGYVFGYRPGEGPRTWDENRPPFLNDLQRLNGIYGYWMKFDGDQVDTLEISGTPVEITTPIPLYSNWNLIGYLPASVDEITHSLATLDSHYVYVMGYQGGSGPDAGPKTWDRARPSFLNDLNFLSPLSGYWVKLDSARTLVYPSGGYVLPKIAPGPPLSLYKQEAVAMRSPPEWCDFWCWQPDLLVEGDIIRVFDGDGVLCGDTLATAEGGGSFLVHVSGDDPETTEIDEGPINGEAVHFTINGDSTVVVSGDNTWTSYGSKRVELARVATGLSLHPAGQGLETFSLLQNYPNPFNAQTVISYQVPRLSDVTVRIFDVTGREVRRLMDNRSQEPGQYRIRWDGCDDGGERVASGIYVCQLQVGSTRFSIKMVLMY